MKICFLGAASVGKSTFLSLLPHLKYQDGSYCHVPFEKADNTDNEDASYISEGAHAISNGEMLPPTTGIRKGTAIIHIPAAGEQELDFIDLPGSSFTKGYEDSCARVVQDIRSYINECECIYFFIEPDDLKTDGGKELFHIFCNVLLDYQKKNKHTPPLICLTLTKADKADHEDIRRGKATPEQVRAYFEEHAGEHLKTMAQHAGGSFFFYAAFSALRQDGLSQGEFSQLFKPLLETKKKHRAMAMLSWLIPAAILLGIGWLYFADIAPKARSAEQDRIQSVLNDTTVTAENVDELLSLAAKLKDGMARQKQEQRIKQAWDQLRQYGEANVKRAKKEYYLNPVENNRIAYNDTKKEYERKFGSKSPLPSNLNINTSVTEIPVLDEILHTRDVNGHMPTFLSMRNLKIQTFLNRFYTECDEAQKILQAVSMAKLFAQKERYVLSVQTKLNTNNRLIFYVQTKPVPIGELYADDEKDEVNKIESPDVAEYRKSLEFEWCIGMPLELHVWNNNYHKLSFTGRIVPARGERIAIRRFCRLDNTALSDTDKEWHREIKLNVNLYHNGKELQKGDLDLVEEFILSDAYWQKRRDDIKQRIIDKELEEL